MTTRRKTTKAKTTKPARTAKPIIGPLTQGQLGALLGTSQQRISQQIKEGLFSPLKSGKLDPFVCVPAYVRAIKRTPDEGMSKIRDLRAQELQQRIARERHETISVKEVSEANEEILLMFRNELWGLPAGCTRDLDLRKTIQTYLDGALGRIARRFEVLARAARSGQPLLEDDGVSDGED